MSPVSPGGFYICGARHPVFSSLSCTLAEGHKKPHQDGITLWLNKLPDINLGPALYEPIPPTPLPTPNSAEFQLGKWWRDKAEAEIGQTVAKAIEYGSTDLIDIGHDLARIAGQPIDDTAAAEWGIYFYLLGKLSRWRSAMERGDRVSDDTLLDIGVYARMAQRVRDAGGWPGINKEDTE